MTRPLFALYVLWHPSYSRGYEIAEQLRARFGRDLFQHIGEGRRVSVLYRREPAPGSRAPLSIDWDDAEFTAVVPLMEATLVQDEDWLGYVLEMARSVPRNADGMELPARFFPVTMDCRGLDAKLPQQALRWDRWNLSDAERMQRLTSDLTHEFCRMLRRRIEALRAGASEEDALGRYLRKIRIFISHSKHDQDGESVARGLRDWIHQHSALESFFDVHDIPPGLSFEDVLMHEVGAGAVVAVHTDSYSSREWCRREVIVAKRRLAPMVVVDCVRDTDSRAMAYQGNVPVIRMDPCRRDRIAAVVACVLDEMFRTWLWLCRVGRHLTDSPGVVFSARPPELIALAALPPRAGEADSTIVYPQPLMSADEERLFKDVAPEVRVRTLTDWLEEHE